MKINLRRILPYTAAGCVLCAWLVSLPAGAQTEGKGSRAARSAARGESKSGESEEREKDHLRAREEWFYKQRRFPLPVIPGGIRQQAIQQREYMRQEMIRRGLYAAGRSPIGSSSPVNPGAAWTPIGPLPTSADGFNFFDLTTQTTLVSGRVSTIAVDPVNSSIVYLGGADGGVWKSTNNGALWTPLTDSQPSLAMGSIAIDPSATSCSSGSCQIIYAGTGELNFGGDNYYGAGILKSMDGGMTWMQLGTAGTVTSNNSAITSFTGPFNEVVGGAFISDIVVNPTTPTILLAGVRIFETVDTGTSSGLYCSNDSGATWKQVISGAPGTAAVYESTGTTAYAALGNTAGDPQNGVYKSTNANQPCTSQSWAPLAGFPTADSGTNAGRISLALAPSTSGSGAVLYAAVAQGGSTIDSSDLRALLKTTNGGTSWSPITNNLPAVMQSTGATGPDFCTPQCFYDMVVKVHPTNPSVVFLGGDAANNGSNTSFVQYYLLQSNNGGANWTSLPFDGTNEIHVDQHAIAFSPVATGTTMLVGNDGGVWSTPVKTSGTPTVTWSDLNATLSLSQHYPGVSIHPSNQLIAYSGFQDNGSQKYDASAAPTTQWTQVLFADGGYTYIDPMIPNIVYGTTEFIPGSSMFIGKSVLDGALDPNSGLVSFSESDAGISVNDNAEFIAPLAGDPTPGNHNVLYFGTCNIYQTVNGALTWTAMGQSSVCSENGGLADYTTVAAAADGNTVYAGDNIGHVHATMNALAGSSAKWTDITGTPGSPLPAATNVSNATDGRIITRIAVAPNNPQIAFVGYSGFCGFVDQVGHIFETQDGGTTWTDISGNGGGCSKSATPMAGALPNTPVNDIVIDPLDTTNKTIYVATDVGVFFTLDGGTTWAPLGTGLADGAVLSLALRNESRTLRAGLHGRGAWDLQLNFSGAQSTYSLVSLQPVSAQQGSGPVTLTLNGMGFSASSVVNFKNAPLTTTFLSSTQLQVTLGISQLMDVGSFPVFVFDTTHPTSNSNALMFSVTVSSVNAMPPNDAITSAIGVNSDAFTDSENAFAATVNTGGFNDPLPINVAGCIPNSTGLANGGAANSIWYVYTPTAAAMVEADTVGSTEDTILSVWTGTPGNLQAVPGACNDDINPGVVVTSQVHFQATGGTTYYIMVSNFEGSASGSGSPGNLVVFNLNASPVPTFTAIAPNSGQTGTTVMNVMLNGGNFSAPLTVNTPAGITATNTMLVSSTTISTTLIIASNATLGPNSITVTASGGTTSSQIFTVSQGPPTLSSISPAQGAQGGTVNVTLTGANFIAGASILFGGTGITPSNVVVTSSTSITATFTISGTATVGAQSVNVMTGTGTTTSTVTFTVLAAPTLSSILPNSGGQNSTVPVTLTGMNFVSPATVQFGGAGVTVNSAVVTNSTTITANFVIAANAALGAQSVTVTSAGVTTSSVTFTVNPPAPTLTAIAPASGVQGNAVSVTLTGTNFVSGAAINVPAGQGIAVSNLVVASATSITATFTLSATATTGAQNVSVTTAGGTSGNVTFTVFAPPTLTSIAPTSGAQGATVPVMLTGTNFGSPATIGFSGGTGITSSAVVVMNSTTITANFVISAAAALGAQNITVTTNGVTTTPPPAVTFTVNPPVPTLTSISPAAATLGSMVNVTLTGTAFQTGSGNTIINAPTGISVLNPNAVSSTMMTATFNIAGNAPTGAQNISVHTAGGTSGNVTFSVGTDFTIAANPTSQTVTRGGSGMTALTLTSSTAGASFPAAVNFAVTGLPTETTCTLNGTACGSFSLPASAGTAGTNTVNLLITTTAPTLVAPRPGSRGPGGMQPWVLLASVGSLGGMLLLWLLNAKLGQHANAGRQQPAWRYAMAVLLVMVLAGLAAACGGSGSGGNMGPPPNPGSAPVGPNMITITASSANASHPATYTMTLQ